MAAKVKAVGHTASAGISFIITREVILLTIKPYPSSRSCISANSEWDRATKEMAAKVKSVVYTASAGIPVNITRSKVLLIQKMVVLSSMTSDILI
ncbi:hypothetical protein C5167_000411 [Papaver somniferum]|uniref:Uncharacterized protein n=1 Tax=Papaver somniferum TaxID=3469 RepID=A0A4Y7KRH0_PAPSO|nr:hypothetical protein C5167_000411 [Papaver somniferum]